MILNKHITKIIIILTVLSAIVCLAAVFFSDNLSDLFGGKKVKVEYESKLFDTDEVMSVDIIMDEDSWNTMLSDAMSELYYTCDVVINGKRINNVAIRPKGNTSLSAIAMDPDSDRFSLKLEFDHFVEGQTCYGLDKLILNNNYADATNMKEAVIYDMYQYIGADASLYNYAKVSVNGEYRGVYLALEGVEQSFMLRNFGTQDGELYKPDTMEMGGNDNNKSSGGFSQKDKEESFGKGGGFAAMGGGGGANLNYTDDDLDSYSVIWDSEITKSSKKDHRRVVTALKNISEGNDLETYLDVDNVLKYMAVHTFAVNMDSLSGSMSHNYYLYEYDGRLNIFPWDYNLSFGGMSIGRDADATEMVNDAIDTPFSGTKFFDALLEDEEYSKRYHEYLNQLTEEYVYGGRFDEVYDRITSQIDSLVETDPTAFYDYEEYITAREILYETIFLRAESIRGQLNNTIPSTDSLQREDSSSFVDASHIDVKAMGQFSMGGFGGGDGDDKGFGGFGGGDFDFSNMPQPGEGFGGFGGGDFDFSNMPDMGDFDFSNMPQPGEGFGGFGGGNFDFPNKPESDSGDSSFGNKKDKGKSDNDFSKDKSSFGKMPDEGNGGFGKMPGQGSFPSKNNTVSGLKTAGTYGIYLLAGIIAVFLVSLVKRRRRRR